jgi:site-specific DNA-cytosine methylase
VRQLVWLDLCSGLGGASQPALDRGWRVIRVDIEPRFKPDIVADVRMLPFRHLLNPIGCDVLWASPPCTYFSRYGLRCFYPGEPAPDMSITHGVIDAISRLHPKFWIVENVQFACRHYEGLLGQPAMKVPGHAFWTNLSLLWPQIQPHKRRAHHLSKRIRQAEAAKIPYEIGEAICRAVEQRETQR